MGLCGWNLLILNHDLAKFDGYRPSGSGDIIDLIFHVLFQNDVIKVPCEFMEGSSSLYIPTLSGLAFISIMVVDIKILVGHVSYKIM